VPGRKGLSWKQYIQAHLEVRAMRFNVASGKLAAEIKELNGQSAERIE